MTGPIAPSPPPPKAPSPPPSGGNSASGNSGPGRTPPPSPSASGNGNSTGPNAGNTRGTTPSPGPSPAPTPGPSPAPSPSTAPTPGPAPSPGTVSTPGTAPTPGTKTDTATDPVKSSGTPSPAPTPGTVPAPEKKLAPGIDFLEAKAQQVKAQISTNFKAATTPTTLTPVKAPTPGPTPSTAPTPGPTPSPTSVDAKEKTTADSKGTDTNAGLTGDATRTPLTPNITAAASALGIQPAELEALSPAEQLRAINTRREARAAEMKLPKDASLEKISSKELNAGAFGVETPTAQADREARAKVNRDVAAARAAINPTGPNAAAETAKLKDIPDVKTSTVQAEVAARLRIDTRGQSPEQISRAITETTSRLNGVDPAGRTTEALQAENRRRALDFLAGQGNLGITRDPSGAYANVSYDQMLQGYRTLYGLSSNATYADVMQTWQDRNGAAIRANPTSVQAQEFQRLGQPPETYYRMLAGLPAATGSAGGRLLPTDASRPPTVYVVDSPTSFNKDFDGDGKADHKVTHTRIVEDQIRSGLGNNVNIQSLDYLSVFQSGIAGNFDVIAQRAKAGLPVDGVNLSVASLAGGKIVTVNDLSKITGMALTPENLAENRAKIRQMLLDYSQTPASYKGPAEFKGLFASKGIFGEDYSIGASIKSIESVTALNVPVTVAAGNDGANQINLFLFANGTTGVNATDASGRIIPNQAVNSLVKTSAVGQLLFKPVTGPGNTYLGLDFTGDGIADLKPSELTAPVFGAKPPQANSVTGSSFAAPAVLAQLVAEQRRRALLLAKK